MGGASIEGPDGPLTGRAAQRHRLALLALLAAAPSGGLTRDKLVAYLWPERDAERARHALSDSVYRINRGLGEETVVAVGDELRLDAERLPSDLAAFEGALEREEWERAVERYTGPFLDGFHLSDAAAFERWVDGERERLARRYASALEALAEERAAAGDLTGAASAWRRRAAHDRYDSRVAVRLMEALEAAGNRAGALRHARIHARLLEQEFGTEPDPEVTALAERLRAAPEAEERGAAPSREAGGGEETSVSEDPDEEVGSEPERPSGTTPPADRRSPRREHRGRRGALVGGLVFLVGAVGAWLAWESAAGGSSPSPPSVAVLPFEDLSADERNRHFAAGVTDDVTTNLARIGDLRVIARTSVVSYRGTEKAVAEIARELDVDYLLEGSVRRSGDRVRITAQLVDARANDHLWAETYDRRLEDIFAVQSDIARSIAGELEAELTPGLEERIERAPTGDLAAYELFLRGRRYVQSYTPRSSDRGIALLRRAIERDPDFALARAWLAKAYGVAVWNYGAPDRWADSAATEAERALALAPDLGEAHDALAQARAAVGRYGEAAASYERALALNPNDWSAVNNLGIVYFLTGRTDRAIRLWRRAVKGNPAIAYITRFNLSNGYQQIGMLDRSAEAARAALSVAPDHPYAIRNAARIDLLRGDTAATVRAAERIESVSDSTDARALLSAGMLYLYAGEPERARGPLARSHALSPTADTRKGHVAVLLGYTLWHGGERERAGELFDEFERFATGRIESGSEYYLLRYSLAEIHAVRGETEEALRWLERAVESGWVEVGITVRDPLLDSLRDEPRYRALVDRMRERNEELRRRVLENEA